MQLEPRLFDAALPSSWGGWPLKHTRTRAPPSTSCGPLPATGPHCASAVGCPSRAGCSSLAAIPFTIPPAGAMRVLI